MGKERISFDQSVVFHANHENHAKKNQCQEAVLGFLFHLYFMVRTVYFFIKVKIPHPYLQLKLDFILSAVNSISLKKSPLSSTYENDLML